jgi:glycosyltransferase involved in cell wall biosynthesis
MKILFITQFLPYPPDTGGKTKTLQTLKLLSREHQIFLVSFVEQKQDLDKRKYLRNLCYDMKTFVTPLITSSHWILKLRVLLGLFYVKPFRIQKYFLKETAAFVEQLTRKENFEIIYCDHETAIQYLPYVHQWQKKLKIYDEHNISSEGFLGYVRYEKNPLVRFVYLVEGIKFRLYEKRMFPVFNRILTISQVDKKKLIEQGISPSKIKFLPIPFKTKPQFNFGSKNILFIGLLSWWPNKDAVLWFYHRIFPIVKEKIPQAKFMVIGANPPEEIKRIGKQDRSVEVAGYVKNVHSYFRKTGVFVAPIRAGAGVRIKILDALARGLPIVATKRSATGIKVKDGKNICLADKEEDFTNAVVKLLEDEKLCRRISQEGLKFIKENYNQKKTLKVLSWLAQ